MMLRIYQLMLGHWISCLPIHKSSKFVGFLWMVTTFLIPKPPMFFSPLHKHPLYQQIKQKLLKMKKFEHSIPKMIQSLNFFQQVCAKQNNKIIKTSLEKQRKKPTPMNILSLIHFLFKQKNKDQLVQQIQAKSSHDSNKYSKLFQLQNQHSVLKIFAAVAGFVLDCQKCPEIQIIPIFLSGHDLPHILKQRQVLYILCLMFLNLVPVQNYHKNQKFQQFNSTNTFSFIFNHHSYKTKIILEFMKLVFFNDKACTQPKKLKLDRRFLIKRQVICQEFSGLLQTFFYKKMLPLQIMDETVSIEQFYGETKIDFANRHIGGGALRKGCVQEEIMYANHPQLYATIVLCESLKPNESLRYQGFSKFFKNQGYSYQTKFGGHQIISNKKQVIVAIDAFDFSKDQEKQYTHQLINREILKAYSGFKNSYSKFIVTGNWGCGAFKGDLKLKLIIQWIAASMAKKSLKHCPYGKNKQINQQKRIIQLIQNFTVGTVYQTLMSTCSIWKNRRRNSSYTKFIDIFYDEIKKLIHFRKQKEIKIIINKINKGNQSLDQIMGTNGSFLDKGQDDEKIEKETAKILQKEEKVANDLNKQKEQPAQILARNLNLKANLLT